MAACYVREINLSLSALDVKRRTLSPRGGEAKCNGIITTTENAHHLFFYAIAAHFCSIA